MKSDSRGKQFRMPASSLSLEQAYAAMQIFLEQHWEATRSDDVGGLLGGMAILQDGTSADPAAWQDWLDAVADATRVSIGDPRLKFELRPPR